MSRKILDSNLMEWEVYATAGDFGYPERSKVVFHCVTDLARRSRFVAIEGDKAEAERMVAEAPSAELSGMLAESTEVD